MFDYMRATQTRPRFYVPSERRGVTLVSNAQIHTRTNLGRTEVRTLTLWRGRRALYQLSYIASIKRMSYMLKIKCFKKIFNKKT